VQKPMSPQELELELAKARQMVAAGRGQEALITALNLLQHALGQLRHGLLALHCNLAQLKVSLAEESDLQTETSCGFPGLSRTGGRNYH
jgi:hypothetical protein